MKATDTEIDPDKCCSVTTIELVMILLGIIILIGVTIGIVCYKKRRVHNSIER